MKINPKELILGILAAASSITVFWFWYKATPLIIAGEFQQYANLIVPVVGLIAAAALFTIAAIFVKNKKILIPAAAISVGAPYLFLSATSTLALLLLTNIFLITFAVHRMRKEFNLSLGFSLTKIAKSGLPLYLTVASLVVSTFYFSLLDEERAISALLPKSALEVTLKSFSGPLQSLTGLPVFRADATVDELLIEILGEQLEGQGIALGQLPKSEVSRLLKTQKAELEKNYSTKLGGEEKVIDVSYQVITERINDLLGPYRKYVPFVSAAAFFFAFKTLTFPLYYLTLLITFLLIKFMIAAKILKREPHEISVERLTL